MTMHWITAAVLISGAVLLTWGRLGLVRKHWRWVLAGGMALLGLSVYIRRKPAETIKPGSLALELHKAEVRRAEKDSSASRAHREEMEDIRRRLEEQVGVAERIRIDRETVLADMHLDDALREMRERAVELGLKP